MVTKEDIEKRISEIEVYVSQGKTINQVMRLLGITSDKTIRRVIAKYPAIQEQAFRNGKSNKLRFGRQEDDPNINAGN